MRLMDKYTLPLLNSILSIYEIIKLELLPPLDFPKLGQLKIKGFEPSQILPTFLKNKKNNNKKLIKKIIKWRTFMSFLPPAVGALPSKHIVRVQIK